VSKKKKLLIITNRFFPQIGGAELNIFLQACELSKHFEVDVLTPVRGDDQREEVVENFRILRAYNLQNPLNRFPYLPAKTLCPAVVTRVLFGGYDLIHCFPALGHNNIIALALARLKGIPIFLSNFDLFDYATLLDQGMDVPSFSKLTIPQRSARRLAKFNTIFTISQKETDRIRAFNPNTFLSTVPVDLKEYQGEPDTEGLRERLGIAAGKRIVLCLSRVSQIKGQDILLRAIPALKQRIDNFVVVFAGRSDYEPSYIDGMKTFVAENGLEADVMFTGPLSREDVLAALKLCDVHVLPMRFMNSGAINTETWISGNPIIQSSRVDPNYIEEGVNGYTFDIDDESSLVEKLVLVLEDPERARKMGENGKKLAMEKFLYPALIAQYLGAYRDHGGVAP
jgi:glycosyltransferase involved in cell wall biosynthesis